MNFNKNVKLLLKIHYFDVLNPIEVFFLMSFEAHLL